jgi:hypothetical protein
VERPFKAAFQGGYAGIRAGISEENQNVGVNGEYDARKPGRKPHDDLIAVLVHSKIESGPMPLSGCGICFSLFVNKQALKHVPQSWSFCRVGPFRLPRPLAGVSFTTQRADSF